LQIRIVHHQLLKCPPWNKMHDDHVFSSLIWTYQGMLYLILRGCWMATSILHSQNFRFQITIYLEGN
jgi:hypothetical protein